MSRRPPAIGAGQVKDTIQSDRLQRQGHQSVRRAKCIEVQQVKTFAPQQTICKETMGPLRTFLEKACAFKDGQVGPQQRKPSRVGIIHHK
jgi:hypothetical protein